MRNDVPGSFQPHAAGVAGIERPIPVHPADVVRGVAGRGEGDEPELAVAGDMNVLRRHRNRLTEQGVERIPIDSPRAGNQARRVDHVRQPDLADVHL